MPTKLLYAQHYQAVYQALVSELRQQNCEDHSQRIIIAPKTRSACHAIKLLCAEEFSYLNLETITLLDWCETLVAGIEGQAGLPTLRGEECVALLWRHINELSYRDYDLGANPLESLARLIRELDHLELTGQEFDLSLAHWRNDILQRYRYRNEHSLLCAALQAVQTVSVYELPTLLVAPEADMLSGLEWSVLEAVYRRAVELWVGTVQLQSQEKTTFVPSLALTEEMVVIQADDFSLANPTLIESSSRQAQLSSLTHALQQDLLGDEEQQITVFCSNYAEKYLIETALETQSSWKFQHLFSFKRTLFMRNILAWLRALVDPDDPIVFSGILRNPPFHVESSELTAINKVIKQAKNHGLTGVKRALKSVASLSPETRDRLEEMVDLHKLFSEKLDLLTPDEFFAFLMKELNRDSSFLELACMNQYGQMQTFAQRLTSRNNLSSGRLFAEMVCTLAELSQTQLFSEATLGDKIRVVPFDTLHPRQLFQTVFIYGDSSLFKGSLADFFESLAHATIKDIKIFAHKAIAKNIERSVRKAFPGGFEKRHFHDAQGQLTDLIAWRRNVMLDNLSLHARKLNELRLDTNHDVIAGISEYLDVLRLVALKESGNSLEHAIRSIDESLRVALSVQQQQVFKQQQTNFLPTLQGGSKETRKQVSVSAKRLPTLSASDINNYLSCPLRYKFGRILSVPQATTINQRFGILMHRVLEVYHKQSVQKGSLKALLELFDRYWYRTGLRGSAHELQLKEKGRSALARYWQTEQSNNSVSEWVERSFDAQFDGFQLRGRVDRVDRLASGEYELIDYKTGKAPKEGDKVQPDPHLQLMLYALAVRMSWKITPHKVTYIYLLDDTRQSFLIDDQVLKRARLQLLEVGAKVQRQIFGPTPSPDVCRACPYRIICPRG